MAKHEVVLHENKGATKEKAPYLGSYITKNQLTLANIIPAAAAKAGMSAIKLQTLIENDIEALTQLEKAGACRIHLDGGYVELRIIGSFDATDASWNEEKNKLVVAFTPNTDLRNSLVNETGTIVTDETCTKVRLDNVFDVERPKPTEILYGRGTFQGQGINLCMGDEGARGELVNDIGVVFPCEVVEVLNRQNVRFRPPELLEPGDYKFVVFSRGGDPAGELQSSFRRVKYIAVEDPITVDDIASEGHEGEIVSGTAFAAKGSGLDAFDAEGGDTVKVKWTQGGEEKEAEIAPAEVAADKLSFEFPDALQDVPMDTELTFEITFGETIKRKDTTLVGE